jgi:AcrR family transcriptional regulator
MPRFKDADRAAIREKLVIEGKELFQRYGLKKTNIEDLARAAGIAKGTFYHFFESKEDLCLAIFDREEDKMSGDLRELLERPGDPARTFKDVIAFSLDFIRGDSLLMRLRESGEAGLLARGVSPDKLAAHLDHDVGTAELVLKTLRAKGARIALPAEVFAGVLRSIVVLALQEKMIGERVFRPVLDLVTGWIADGLVKGKGNR